MAESVETAFQGVELGTDKRHLEDLLPALQRLDRLLERAAAAAQSVYGPEAAADPYRGLYISRNEFDHLLARESGAPTLYVNGEQNRVNGPSPLKWLRDAFDLSSFDIDVMLIALAPELDLRYERLYAYLQDDVTRRRPTVDLALNLLCPSADEKLARRSHFASDAPLIQNDLLHLLPDPSQLRPPLLAHYLKLDDQIVHLLLGQKSLDARLTAFCEMIEPMVALDELPLKSETRQTLSALATLALTETQPLRLYFYGARGIGKRRAAEALAYEIGAPLLVAELARAPSADSDLERVLRLLFREAWLQNAVLYLDGVDELRDDQSKAPYEWLLDKLADDPGVTILAGMKPWMPAGRNPIGMVALPFPGLDFAERRDCWEAKLSESGLTINSEALDVVAGRFRLTPTQIAEAIATAHNHSLCRAATQRPPKVDGQQVTNEDLLSAARSQCGRELAKFSHKVQPMYTWADIVLPDEVLDQLREICERVAYRHRVMEEWGFGHKLSLGKGINVLFAGASGTGKSMAAEAIARELGLDLFKIDLSSVQSRWVGETEKNLDRIFTAAEDSNCNAILFFDEADAIFGKRSEVRDAHDRYANIEISYLLQKMEEYEGLAILATNLSQNLDEAFLRRLTFTIHFPFPDQVSRKRIWADIWPRDTPLANDIDLDYLACQFRLSGGNIKNVALAAAFLAAKEDGPVTLSHVLQAVRREYQKMGKDMSDM